MAAARYWRLVGIEAFAGGDLELSEIAMFSGATRIDGAATLTSSHVPVAGSLTGLGDGDTSTSCRFLAADVSSSGFFLQWDYGTVVDCSEVKLGATASVAMFLHAATLLRGTDAGWVVVASIAGAVFPGSNALTASTSGGVAPTTWNPNDKGTGAVLSNGNLTLVGTQSVGWARSAYGATAGKYYWEISSTGSRFPFLGIARPNATLGAQIGENADNWAFYGPAPYKGHNKVYQAYGTKWLSSAQVVGVALDMDAGTIELFMNGASMGVMYSGVTGAIHACSTGDTDSGTSNCTANFGASPFAYEPPPGHTRGFGASFIKLPVTAAPRLRTASGGIAVAAASDIPAFGTSTAGRPKLARDVEHGGPGTIYGTTKTKGTPNLPTKARVVLLHQRSKLPVRETWSDPVTGAFAFTGIDTAQQFLTLAEDAAGNFRPVAANRLTPEVLP